MIATINARSLGFGDVVGRKVATGTAGDFGAPGRVQMFEVRSLREVSDLDCRSFELQRPITGNGLGRPDEGQRSQEATTEANVPG